LRFFISGPSGAGKSTIIKALLETRSDIVLSVSYTTRSPRPSEINGRDYFFINKHEFEKMIADGAFLEWAHVHSDYYGTSIKWVDDMETKGINVIFDIDIQGVRQAKAKGTMGCFVMVAPPDLETLQNRLGKRGTETPQSLAIRLDNALRELKAVDMYDYILINDVLENVIEDIKTIIRAEGLKRNEMLRSNEWLQKIR
jgi:guanylate kinase